MRHVLGALTLISALSLNGQKITGRIYDEVNELALPGASIQILGAEKGATTDENGVYTLDNLPPDRYSLRASFIGYKPVVVTDIWVRSGRVTVQDFALARDYTGLEEVVVVEEVILSQPGRIDITEEHINRFAATYYDPARLATSSADVAVANDQNNRISARGISPAYNTWRLEGVEIVNPNHLSNAGTFTDQPIATGGGVNMLSAQMLDRSSFLYSTFDNTYTNSVGGLFDMHLKNGNKLDRQYTAQASLIGFDLATEGPFKEGGRATYSANYRYSFTGLLTNFGVDFGGESIGFQDLAMNVVVPVGQRSELKIFGVGGLSSNDFEHRPISESEVAKDRSDIYYDNKTGIVGASLSSNYEKGRLIVSAAFSGYENRRTETLYDNEDVQRATDATDNSEAIGSLHPRYTRRLGRQKLKAGGMVNLYRRQLTNQRTVDTQFTQEQYLVQPYVQLSGPIGTRFSGTIGFTYNHARDDSSYDPRASLTYVFGQFHSVSVGSGLYSQLINPYNFLYNNPYGEIYVSDHFGLIQSLRNTLSYLYARSGFNIGMEVFDYRFAEVRIKSEDEQARTYGVTLSSEKSFRNNFYFRLGGSLFSSTISGPEENQYDNRFNLSAATGREWVFRGTDKNRSLSLNGRLLYQGGQNFSQLQVSSGNDVGLFPDIPAYRTQPYFRFDVKVQWTWHKENRSSYIALDLQNAIGYENEAFKYYDEFTSQVETQYQLGLIPILTYRVEW